MEKLINSSKLTNWDININAFKYPNPIPDPIGFNCSYVETTNPKAKLKEVSLFKKNIASEFAMGQAKQLFMTLLTFYFVGGNLSIFTIFFIGMYGYNSINAIFNVNNGMFYFKYIYINNLLNNSF